jgi:hypothetical protein
VSICLTVSFEFREVVVKGRVNHAIRHGGSTAEAFEDKITSMHVSASGGKRLGGRIRASETEYLISSTDKFPDDSGPDEACGTCNENTHILFLLVTVQIRTYRNRY